MQKILALIVLAFLLLACELSINGKTIKVSDDTTQAAVTIAQPGLTVEVRTVASPPTSTFLPTNTPPLSMQIEPTRQVSGPTNIPTISTPMESTRPTSSPTSAPPTLPGSDVALYDTFSDPRFDNAVNTDLWSIPRNPPLCPGLYVDAVAVKQKSGILTFDVACPTDPYIIEVSQGNRKDIAGMRMFEVRMRVGPSQGNASGKLWMQISGDAAGNNWSTVCAITIPGGGEPSLTCIVYGNSAKRNDYSTNPVKISTDTWYKVRIEMDPASGQIRYYLNAGPLGEYTPSYWRNLSYFTPGIGVVKSSGTDALGTLSVSEVRVSP